MVQKPRGVRRLWSRNVPGAHGEMSVPLQGETSVVQTLKRNNLHHVDEKAEEAYD